MPHPRPNQTQIVAQSSCLLTLSTQPLTTSATVSETKNYRAAGDGSLDDNGYDTILRRNTIYSYIIPNSKLRTDGCRDTSLHARPSGLRPPLSVPSGPSPELLTASPLLCDSLYPGMFP